MRSRFSALLLAPAPVQIPNINIIHKTHSSDIKLLLCLFLLLKIKATKTLATNALCLVVG
nr:MAG TPA: hypothetical protein [Caudoviricetes sp.]